MDPALDPPPVSAHPTGPLPSAAPSPAAANPTPAHPVPLNHPPYAEMIAAAISALKERDGSSKRAIAKYIESHYADLPPTHSALLAHHLKRLKTNGQLLMVKKSYKLPSRSTAAVVNGAVNAVYPDPGSTVPKRRPGRPPKLNPDAGQAAVPVFAAPLNMNAEGGISTENVAVGPVNGGPASGGHVRGRGRPPKRGSGRPLKSGVAPLSGSGGGRGRGRPRKTVAAIPAAKGSGRPRGRPPKPINVLEGLVSGAPMGAGMPAVVTGGAPPVDGGGVAPLGVKRRGRPPKVGGMSKKPRNMNAGQSWKPRKLSGKTRKLSGKPLGRPKKIASSVVNRAPDSQLLVAYLDLKGQLDNLQTKVMETVALIRPSLNSEASINALRELEVAVESTNAPRDAQILPQQPQPQPQTQPQPQPQPQTQI